jgi:hypothetical protein
MDEGEAKAPTQWSTGSREFLVIIFVFKRSIWQAWDDLSVRSEGYKTAMPLNFYMRILLMLRHLLDVLIRSYDSKRMVQSLKIRKMSENHKSRQLFAVIYPQEKRSQGSFVLYL